VAFFTDTQETGESGKWRRTTKTARERSVPRQFGTAAEHLAHLRRQIAWHWPSRALAVDALHRLVDRRVQQANPLRALPRDLLNVALVGTTFWTPCSSSFRSINWMNCRICKPPSRCTSRTTTSAACIPPFASLPRWKQESRITFGPLRNY
jgi:hypothetical protein